MNFREIAQHNRASLVIIIFLLICDILGFSILYRIHFNYSSPESQLFFIISFLFIGYLSRGYNPSPLTSRKREIKDYTKIYEGAYTSTYIKEYIGGYEGVRNFTADVGFVNLLTTVVYTSAVNYQADGLYFGSGITNYRGTFDGLTDYSTDYTKIWLGNENYLRAWNPTYTGDQYFETQWSGSRTSHSTFVGNTNFIGAHSGALANTKPRLFLKKDDIWEQAKKLFIREKLF